MAVLFVSRLGETLVRSTQTNPLRGQNRNTYSNTSRPRRNVLRSL